MDPAPKWEYIVLYLIPLGTIWGNVLVCLAVYLERRLRHRFNLFLVSLAISDLLCALLVMPVSAWQMITGGTSRDRTLCLVWYSMDIFFTATTIIHLCSISLDRYLALRRPFTRNRNMPRIFHSLVIRIVMSWLIPFSIAGPLFLFALQQHEQELERAEIQLTSNRTSQLSTVSSIDFPVVSENLEITKSYKGCGPNDPSFVLTAIGVTFVLPLIIMTTTYVLTVRMLRQHMEQVKSMRLYKPTSARTIRPVSSPYLKRAHSDRASVTMKKPSILLRNLSARGFESGLFSRQPSAISQSKHLIPEQSSVCAPSHLSEQSEVSDSNNQKSEMDTIDRNGTAIDHQGIESSQARRIDQAYRKDELALVSDEVEAELQGADNKLTIYQDYRPSSPLDRNNAGAMHCSTFARIHSGKRAVRVIGVLFGLFVACYLPFFIVYIIDVLCLDCKRWTGVVIPHLEWLGYLSSMLNPVVYHSFNSTFRRTFRRIFRCACRSTPDHHAIWCRRV